MRNNTIVYFVLYILLSLFINTAYAGLSVSTGLIETAAYREKETVESINVVNTGNLTTEVDVSISEFSGVDISPSSWFTVEPQKFELKSGESRLIHCRFTPAKDAAGELRARINISGKEIGEGKSPVGVRFNIAVYVAVQGTLELGVGIEKIDTTYNIKEGEIQGEIYLNNGSNVHIRPYISITVKDLEGKHIGDITVPFGQPAQREETREFIFKEKMDLKPGRYKIIADVDYGKLYGLEDFIVTKEAEFEVSQTGAEGTETTK